MLSLYDYPFARLAEQAGIDIILVGDSLGMVVHGYDSTVPVRLDDIIYHTRAVRRGAPRTHIVADMPFLTYQIDTPRAVENAGRLLQEGGADSVKLEGGREIADRVAAIVRAGIPVMGHIGLTPQSAGALGGFRVQGRDAASARQILDDARAITEAGAFATVVEVIPTELGAMITGQIPIPTIGIGAGPDCDGQVLVAHDMLGLQERIIGRFAKVYAEAGNLIEQAFADYAAEVQAGVFPDEEHSYRMPERTMTELEDHVS
ncbi:MAG: 3-methyl-2-oxobutanoate hydroxymethyltransferase [Thermomicrobiales bacterium]|nr:3-methyl-2-oxobutanoate hydroxymethyltransferase [Thermomicrobiales bacterium]MCB0067994.1 3-methyl-2-oxobutanoate hydroxymethyltransferase [Caldilineaceae bacterium]